MISIAPIQEIIKSNEFLPLMLCIAEIALCISHLLVHLGIKNSRLDYLSHQAMYFSIDGFLTTLNLFYFWERYFILKPFLILAILCHLYYVSDLLIHSGKSRIFYWSCVDCEDNRFGMKYLRENIETLLDVTCHFFGAYNFFTLLDVHIGFACVFSAIILIWIGMVGNKDFFTKDYMMPVWLKNIIGIPKKNRI